ncbi:MAG: SpoIIE family protein phosphatase [Bacillota bacterium]|nr:SpoIIE family protein phosphatase [Bacillota bacterium]
MGLFLETYVRQLTKWGEELCGDNVEIIRTREALTITVADGLGSGVKANILATLTTKIASSMLREGAGIDEVIATIAETLPVCKVRELAYSTIAILQIRPNGESYLAEFDTPDTLLLKNGQIQELARVERVIAGRKIRESHFTLELGDSVILISDGVIHAGVGAALNMGWQWNNVARYISTLSTKKHSLRSTVSSLINTCGHLYAGKPGDDVTVVGIRASCPLPVTILSGPPRDKSQDGQLVSAFLASPGAKVICGGSTAQMVARETGLSLSTELDSMDDELPPIAQMQGIDLVTEGILTLTAAMSIIRIFAEATDDLSASALLKRSDGASMLADLLLNRCTHLRLLIGCAVNEAHLESMPLCVGFRQQLATDLAKHLRSLGKEVVVEYY